MSSTPAPISSESLAAQSARLLALPSVRRSPNSARLLRYLFARLAAGRGSPSQYEIAYEVLGLGEGYDPDRNPVVRMQVARLRRALESHYEGLGAADPVIVAVPRGSYGLSVSRRASLRRRTSPAPSGATLAVVEFRSLGLEGHWRHLPALLAEELMACLGRLPGLRLLGPFSRARLEADGVEPVQLGARHRADFVLDGSLQPTAEGHVLRLRLLHGPSGALVWSLKRACGKGACDLAFIEGALMSRLAEELGADYGVIDRHLSALARVRPAAALDVREALVTARAYFATYTAEFRDRALVSLRRACRRYPDEPLPKASLALVLFSLTGEAAWTDPVPLGEIERLAAEAYQLDPSSPWCLAALAAAALLLRRDDELEALADRVDGREPAAVLIRGSLGLWLVLRRRRVDQGLAWVADALRANPHHPPVLHMAHVADRLLARDSRGLVAAIEDYNWPGGWLDALMRAAAAALAGDRASAKLWLGKAQAADPTLVTHGLARCRRLWHEDYLVAMTEILESTGLRLPASSRPLP